MITLLAQLEFAAPGRLIVLVLLPALAWVALLGRRRQSWLKLASSTALRCLVVLLMCVAWAGPSCRRASQRQFVVFAVDESASCWLDSQGDAATFVESAWSQRGSNQARWLPFGTSPGRIESSQPGSALRLFDPQPGSDIATAIEYALASTPADHVPKVVLLSDGLETSGDALSAAAAAATPISVLPMISFVTSEVAVEAIDAPSRLPSHASSVDVSVTITSNRNGFVDVELSSSADEVDEVDEVGTVKQTIQVTPGTTQWRTRFPLRRSWSETGDPTGNLQPTLVLQARIVGGRDTFVENNTLKAIILGDPPRRALLVETQTDARAELAQTIQQLGFQAERRKFDAMADSAAVLQSYDLVVLANVSASQLGPARLAAVEQYVRQGGGLIVVGEGNTFGAAAYELTALERMLPVVATEQPVEQQKSLALVLVVDKSKSMEQENRLGLAKEAAKKVAEVLQQRDQVGVLAFGDETEWISRLAPLDNKDEVLARIDKLEASGLTNMYPALQRAYLSLSQADADSRHAILLTDGVPTPGDFDEIAKKMAAAGITVSTVSLGKGADQTILADIARLARGVHHHVDDPSDLPKILEREAQTAASKVTDNEFTVETLRQLPGLNVSDAPTIAGYVATNYKPGAQLLLTAGEGDPLLAWWRYGRGEAMVLTTGLGEGAKQWQDWRGYAAFWKRLVTHAMRRRTPPRREFFVSQRDGHVTVRFDAHARPDEPIAREDGQALLAVTKLSSAETTDLVIMMPQVRPGIYDATFDAQPGDALLLDVGRQADGETHFKAKLGFYVPYREEFRLRVSDERKLKHIASATGGKFNPSPDEVFQPDGRTVEVVHPLWTYVLIAAILAYLADVAIRRTDALVRPSLPARRQEQSKPELAGHS